MRREVRRGGEAGVTSVTDLLVRGEGVAVKVAEGVTEVVRVEGERVRVAEGGKHQLQLLHHLGLISHRMRRVEGEERVDEARAVAQLLD